MKLVLVLLVLVSTCGAETWTPVVVCQDLLCPSYNVVHKYSEYEERTYPLSEWITTEIYGDNLIALMAARGRLLQVKNYKDAWPAVIWVTNEKVLTLAWFVATDSKTLEIPDSVTLQKRENMKVFVKPLMGSPTISGGKEEKEQFCHMLGDRCSATHPYAGAAYKDASSFRSEIWILENP